MTLLQSVPLAALTIEDAGDFAEMPLYAQLEGALLAADVHYLVAAPGSAIARWDHVALLNHGFWSPSQPDDVLEGRVLTADVVAHRAWHHLAGKALGGAAVTTAGLMLGEAVASAFDAFMVGTLLSTRPAALMLETQLPAMTEAMGDAGLPEPECEAIFTAFAAAPRAAFAQLFGLLYETGVALCACEDTEAAAGVLEATNDHPLAPLLHHYRLATWVLYARGVQSAAEDASVPRTLAARLLAAQDPLQILVDQWLRSPPA